MKVIFKTDNTEFSKLGIGIINTYSFQYVPKCVKLNFNQVYYMVENQTLIAFKLIAIDLFRGNYIIQTPQGIRIRRFTNGTLIFASKEHYFDYISNKRKPLPLAEFTIEFDDKCVVCHPITNMMSVYSYYSWNEQHSKPTKIQSKINAAIMVEEGIVIYHTPPTTSFSTYEQCVEHHLNGMTILDFETEFSFTIKVQETTKPIVHTLRFIEE